LELSKAIAKMTLTFDLLVTLILHQGHSNLIDSSRLGVSLTLDVAFLRGMIYRYVLTFTSATFLFLVWILFYL